MASGREDNVAIAAGERPQRQLDSTIDIVTPENIAFQYQVAGPFRRLPAFAIDLCLRAFLLLGMGFALLTASSAGWLDTQLSVAVLLLAWFLLEWFYGGLLETYWNGQTVGKRLTRLRVLSASGQPINGMQAVLRNVLRTVDLMPVLPLAALTGEPQLAGLPTGLVGLVSPLLGGRYQRLGDLVSGTIVVIEEREGLVGTVPLRDPRVAHLADRLPAGYVVGKEMAVAVSRFVERRRFLPPDRRCELAWHLGGPLRASLDLPADTDPDLLLCALYHRAFGADRVAGEAMWTEASGAVDPRAPSVGE
jgi:uncharacterized RDD family membrane protein YckC